jgi:hypothetical protein
MSPAQLAEWSRNDRAKSVYNGAGDPLLTANRIWDGIALPLSSLLPDGGAKRRAGAVKFDPSIGTTRSEMLDQMVRVSH